MTRTELIELLDDAERGMEGPHMQCCDPWECQHIKARRARNALIVLLDSGWSKIQYEEEYVAKVSSLRDGGWL